MWFLILAAALAGPLTLPEPGKGYDPTELKYAIGDFRAAQKDRQRFEVANKLHVLVQRASEKQRPETLFWFGRALDEAGLSLAAMHHMIEVINSTPERDLNNGSSVIISSAIAHRTGNIEPLMALVLGHPAALAPGKDPDQLRYVLMRHHLAEGNHERVHRLWKPSESLREWTSLKLGVIVGQTLLAEEKPDQARDVLTSVAKADTGGADNPEIHAAKARANYLLGTLALADGDNKKALAAFSKGTPDGGLWGMAALAEAARLQASDGKAKEAAKSLKDALKVENNILVEVQLASAEVQGALCKGSTATKVLDAVDASLAAYKADAAKAASGDWDVSGQVEGVPRRALLELLEDDELLRIATSLAALEGERARLQEMGDPLLTSLTPFYDAKRAELDAAAKAATAPTGKALEEALSALQAKAAASRDAAGAACK